MIVSLVSIPGVVLADTYGLERTAGAAHYDVGKEDIFSSVQKVVSAFLGLLAIIFFILVTYAGVRWMIARGNEEYVEEAKNTLESAIIGLIVVMSAYAITTFIFTKLSANVGGAAGGGGAATTPTLPPAVSYDCATPENQDVDVCPRDLCDWNNVTLTCGPLGSSSVCAKYTRKGDCDTHSDICAYLPSKGGCIEKNANVNGLCAGLLETDCSSLSSFCAWNGTSCVHKDSFSVTPPDWCVVLSNAKEVSCSKPQGTSCATGPQAMTNDQVANNFVCPFDPSNPLSSCPGYSQEECGVLEACVWNGSGCGPKTSSATQLTACNEALFDDDCTRNLLCTMISSPTNGNGCATKSAVTQCVGEAANAKQDTCSPMYLPCKQVCTKKFNDCSFDDCQGGNDATCIQQKCTPAQIDCERACVVSVNNCNINVDASMWACIDASPHNYY